MVKRSAAFMRSAAAALLIASMASSCSGSSLFAGAASSSSSGAGAAEILSQTCVGGVGSDGQPSECPHQKKRDDDEPNNLRFGGAGSSVGRDGHSIAIIEEDVTLFKSNTIYEVSIGATAHRVAFSPRLVLVEEPMADPIQHRRAEAAANAALRAAGESNGDAEEELGLPMLICRLPTLNVSLPHSKEASATEVIPTRAGTATLAFAEFDAEDVDPSPAGEGAHENVQHSTVARPSSAVRSLVLDDVSLRERVAAAIDDELRDEPCLRARWAAGGSAPLLTSDGAHDVYELCYSTHFRRVGEPKRSAVDKKQSDAQRMESLRLSGSNNNKVAKVVDDDSEGDDFDLSGEEVAEVGAAAAATTERNEAHASENVGEKKPSTNKTASAPADPADMLPTEIFFGRRQHSDVATARATGDFLDQLRRSGVYDDEASSGKGEGKKDKASSIGAASPSAPFVAHHSIVSSDLPSFNEDTGRWELLLPGGDACIRHVDLAEAEAEAAGEGGRKKTFQHVPFRTVLFFSCGQRRRLLDTSVNTMSTTPRIVINRDAGRCEYQVGVEAAAVCEWDARLRAATVSPILCNRI